MRTIIVLLILLGDVEIKSVKVVFGSSLDGESVALGVAES